MRFGSNCFKKWKMMKIVTRICVLFLMAAGLFFLRESNQPKDQTPETKTNSVSEASETKNEEKNPVVLEFTQSEKSIESRVKTLQKRSGDSQKISPVLRSSASGEGGKNTNQEKAILTPQEKKQEAESIAQASEISLVKVFLYEWAFDISSREIPKGKVIFEVHNDGRFSHDFSIKGYKHFGKVFPGETAYFVADYLGGGEYTLYSPKKVDQDYRLTERLTVR